jgi:hypothetical protein
MIPAQLVDELHFIVRFSNKNELKGKSSFLLKKRKYGKYNLFVNNFLAHFLKFTHK